MDKKYLCISFVFIAFLNCVAIDKGYAQLVVPFKVRYQNYVKGDMTLIANNIVNRYELTNAANSNFNNRSENAKFNDQFNMQYIDIDADKQTFSSSSANLNLEDQPNKKILYAGLYWSATYLYNSSRENGTNTYVSVDGDRENFDAVKLKLPNSADYIDIKGDMIFDGLTEENFKESAPYAMYADVTQYVTALNNPYGTYTVANVRSTTGKLSGGVSAGWSIFFIYEDVNKPGKYITSFDGFAGVTKNAVDVEFSNFEAIPKGAVNAKIAAVALEGDLNLVGDQLLINSDFDEEFTFISSKNREKKNIFNSSISLYDNIFIDRKPNSKNTLGFDAFILNIDNPNNSVIHNNASKVTLRLKTFGDRYFIFFTAFAVDVLDSPNYKSNSIVSSKNDIPKTTILSVAKSSIAYQKSVADATSASVPGDNIVVKGNTTTKQESKNSIIQESSITNQYITTNKDANIQSVTEKNGMDTVSTLESSVLKTHYLIVNVFAKESNATKFVASLNKRGLQANYFINPKNNYKYVFISKDNNFEETKKQYSSKMNGKYKEAAWIMSTNPKVDQVKYATTTLVSNDNETGQQDKIQDNIVVATNVEQKLNVKPTAINNNHYIIANVFAIHSNATKFVAALALKGIKANFFINPKNNYRYVYLVKKDSYQEAFALHASQLNGTYKRPSWIMTVRNETTDNSKEAQANSK